MIEHTTSPVIGRVTSYNTLPLSQASVHITQCAANTSVTITPHGVMMQMPGSRKTVPWTALYSAYVNKLLFQRAASYEAVPETYKLATKLCELTETPSYDTWRKIDEFWNIFEWWKQIHEGAQVYTIRPANLIDTKVINLMLNDIPVERLYLLFNELGVDILYIHRVYGGNNDIVQAQIAFRCPSPIYRLRTLSIIRHILPGKYILRRKNAL